MKSRLLLLGVALVTFGSPGTLWTEQTATNEIEIRKISLGFDGVAKVGTWVPLTVEIKSRVVDRSVRLVAITQDSSGVDCSYEDPTIHRVSAVATTRIRFDIRLGRIKPVIRVEVWEADQLRANTSWRPANDSRILVTTNPWIVSLGGSLPWEQATRQRQTSSSEKPVATQISSAAALPVDRWGYEGVDLLVITSGDLDFLGTLTKEQWLAIRNYVRFGGRLILSLSWNARDVWRDQVAFRELIPAEVEDAIKQKETTGLETFSGSQNRVDLEARQKNQVWAGVAAVRYSSLRARPLVFDGVGTNRSDWIVQSNFGLGIVTLVACDWSREPLRSWPGLPNLIARLLDTALCDEATVQRADGDRRVTHLGYEDLAGQLRMALDQFDNVRLISLSSVVLLIAVYVFLVGVGDYGFLWWTGARFNWTWWTLPAIILAACGASFWLAQRWKGSEIRANRFELVDFDPESGTARGRGFVRFFSPRANRFSIVAQPRRDRLPAWDDELTICSWQGLPGSGLGGMSSVVSTGKFSDPYQHHSDGDANHRRVSLSRVDLAPWSSWGLVTDWMTSSTPAKSPALKADSLGLLSGAVVNPLPFGLRDCGLCFGRWYFPLSDLAPGGQQVLERGLDVKDFLSHLTRRRVLEDKEVTAPWNKVDTDLNRLGEMLMFHQAAKGQDYTGLRDQYLARLDFTDQSRLRTAILVGRADKPLTKLQWTSPSAARVRWGRSVVYVRLLIPVEFPAAASD